MALRLAVLLAFVAAIAGIDADPTRAASPPAVGAPVAPRAWPERAVRSRHVASRVVYHHVRWGETLWGIARRHGTTVAAIKHANGLVTDRIYAGQTLRIPGYGAGPSAPWLPGGVSYTVRWGDTLWSIARRYGATVSGIMRANGLRSHRIYAGQTLRVPLRGPRPPTPAPWPTPVPWPTPAPTQDPLPPHVPRYPEVHLQPRSGPPGTVVRTVLVRFPPGETARISMVPYGAEPAVVRTVAVDNSGQAVTWFTVNAPAGTNMVIAAWADPPDYHRSYASALFEVR